MEQLQEAIRQLTGAVNAQIELSKKVEQRLQKLESASAPTVTPEESLRPPRDETELKEICKLPDCVKELQIFDGNPVQYVSWIHNVENILKDFEIVRNKPIYRAILQSIRQKIRGPADSALISYNIFGDSWPAIKKCLSLHYADKRDIRTLEHQLSLLTQGNMRLDEFYATVNHQFSLIINKLKTEDHYVETTNVLIETYRNRALDVFIRGVNGELSRMLMIRKPLTLPEAYASCLEIQNLNFRNVNVRKPYFNNAVTTPINQFYPQSNKPTSSNLPSKSTPKIPPKTLPLNQRNEAYNIQHNQRSQPPPRPTQAKPPVPMEVDPSMQTKQVNYMNRPTNNNYAYKRDHGSDNHPYKQQRINTLETGDGPSEEEYSQTLENEAGEEYAGLCEEEEPEVNFMTGASLAYLT